jgi:hypothetical protein
MSFFERGPPKALGDGVIDREESDLESGRSSKPPEITSQREYVLWKTWLDEIAPWVRKSTAQEVYSLHESSLTNSTISAILSIRFQ